MGANVFSGPQNQRDPVRMFAQVKDSRFDSVRRCQTSRNSLTRKRSMVQIQYDRRHPVVHGGRRPAPAHRPARPGARHHHQRDSAANVIPHLAEAEMLVRHRTVAEAKAGHGRYGGTGGSAQRALQASLDTGARTHGIRNPLPVRYEKDHTGPADACSQAAGDAAGD